MKHVGGQWEGPPTVEILPGLVEWWEAFFELSTERQIGMAAGPIPHGAIERWSDGWPWDDADAFHQCMRAMDALYLKGDKSDPPDGFYVAKGPR